MYVQCLFRDPGSRCETDARSEYDSIAAPLRDCDCFHDAHAITIGCTTAVSTGRLCIGRHEERRPFVLRNACPEHRRSESTFAPFDAWTVIESSFESRTGTARKAHTSFSTTHSLRFACAFVLSTNQPREASFQAPEGFFLLTNYLHQRRDFRT